MGLQQKLKCFTYSHKNIITSIGVNAVFLLLCYIFNGFMYELSDDWFFSDNISNGNYNFTFCNYFIQVISGLLQKLIYPVNAFMLLQLIFGFVAMTSISYIFLDTFKSKKSIFVVLFIQSAFALNVYSLITFTKTAAILITAGGLMIFWAQINKKHLIYSVFGAIMMLTGSFYRFQVFYSVFVVFAFFVLAYILYNTKSPHIKGFFVACREFLQIRTLSVLVILIISVFSLNTVSRAILASDDELDYYREYNSSRSSVVDYRITPFEKASEQYEALGISENDLRMLANWYLDDEGLASIETLDEVAKISEGRYTTGFFLLHMLSGFFGYAEVILFAAYIFVVVAMLLLYRKKSLFFICPIAVAIGLLYLYLFIIGRCNYRTAFAIWFEATVFLLYSSKIIGEREKVSVWVLKNKLLKNKYIVPVCGLIYAFFFSYGTLVVAPEIGQTFKNDYPELENHIASSEGKIFALCRNWYLNLRNSTQFDNPMILTENEVFDKCVYFGTPYYAHPYYNDILENSGIDNLYTALASKDNLYFVDNACYGDVEKIITYLNEHYSEEKVYSAECTDKGCDFAIYKIKSVEKYIY